MASESSSLVEVLSSGDVAEARSVYSRVLQGDLTLTRAEWFLLISAFRHDLEQLQRVWCSMLDYGIQPAGNSMESLLRSFTRAGLTVPTNTILSLVRKSGLTGGRLWTALIQCLVLEQDLSTVRSSLRTMITEGFKPETHFWAGVRWPTDNAENLQRLCYIFEQLGSSAGSRLNNEVLKLQTRSGDLDGAVQTLDVCLRENGTPSVDAIASLVRRLARAGDMVNAEKVLATLRSLGVEPNAKTLNVMTVGYAERGDVADALKLRDEMLALGLQPEAQTLQVLLRALATSPASLGSEPTHPASNSLDFASTFATPTLLRRLVRSGDLQMALRVREEMSSQGMIPDAPTLGILLRALARAGDLEGALRIREEMSSLGLAPNAPALGSLLGALARAGQLERALSIREEMSLLGLVPDAPTLGILLRALARSGNLEGASRIREDMSSLGLVPDAPTLGSQLAALVRAGNLEGALHIRDEMSSLGLELNAPTLSSLLRAVEKSGNRPAAESIQAELLQLESTEIEIETGFLNAEDERDDESSSTKAQLATSQPPEVTWGLQIAQAARKDPGEAEQLIESMLAGGIRPNLRHWTPIIGAYAAEGDSANALRVFEAMRLSGVTPDLFCWNNLLKSYSFSGDISAMDAQLEAMKTQGIAPNAFTWGLILRLYRDRRMPKHAQQAFASMVESGVKPNNVTVTLLIEALVSSGDVPAALAAIDLLQRTGTKLDQKTLSAALKVYQTNRDVHGATELFGIWEQSGVAPDTWAWNGLLWIYGQLGDTVSMRGLLIRMKERGVQPDTHTWAQLVRAYCAKRDLPGARALLDQLRVDGIEVSAYHWVPILNELAESRDVDGLAAEEKRIEPRLLSTAPVIGVLLKGYGNCRRTDLAEATVGRASGCLEDVHLLGALARVYALSRERPRDLERFSTCKRAESPETAVTNAWVGLALSFSGSEQEALRWMSGLKGSRVMFFHGVRCSVASRVGAAELATALRQLFDDVNLTTEEISEAYSRLAITSIRAHREVNSELVAELNEAFVNQLRGGRSARAVLSDLIRAQTYPWLAMTIAFSNRLDFDFLELEVLLEDESARKRAIQDLDFARTWSSSQVNSG
jgi:pentatricopeptide repeat protein